MNPLFAPFLHFLFLNHPCCGVVYSCVSYIDIYLAVDVMRMRIAFVGLIRDCDRKFVSLTVPGYSLDWIICGNWIAIDEVDQVLLVCAVSNRYDNQMGDYWSKGLDG